MKQFYKEKVGEIRRVWMIAFLLLFWFTLLPITIIVALKYHSAAAVPAIAFSYMLAFIMAFLLSAMVAGSVNYFDPEWQSEAQKLITAGKWVQRNLNPIGLVILVFRLGYAGLRWAVRRVQDAWNFILFMGHTISRACPRDEPYPPESE